ncbi:MAG: 2Fe-2S iron-sulfur cluster-binding protein, partial [Acidimicrobiia bacterium]
MTSPPDASRPPTDPAGTATPTDTAPGAAGTYELRVNGQVRLVESPWLGESLLSVLRERLGLYGTKNACEQGECGSCSVLVDGALVCACLELAAAAVGTDITTV